MKICCAVFAQMLFGCLFGFNNRFRRFRYNVQAIVAHTVKQRIKLATFCGFTYFLVREEKLIYGYIVTGDKLIKDGR